MGQKNLYLFIEVSDPTPLMNSQQPESLWNGDAVELFIGHEDLDKGGPPRYSDRQVLIRGARPHGVDIYIAGSPRQETARSLVVPNLDGKGYTLEAAIPFPALGFEPQPNQELLFDIAVDDGTEGTGRIRQIVFNGNARNSKDRGAWGKATLLK